MTNPCICGHEKLEHGFDGNCFYLVAPLKVCPCLSFRPAEPSPEKPNMTLEQKIQAIREKCIAANPEIDITAECDGNCGKKHYRPIRLADVLLAINDKLKDTKYSYYEVSGDGDICVCRGTYDGEGDEHSLSKWNLRADDLNLQTPETINFLAELLK